MEIAIVLIIALIVLGPKKLPEAGRSLGKSLREFKDTVGGIGGGDDDAEPARRQVAAQATADDGSGIVQRTEAAEATPSPVPAQERESVS